jgi:hypothetical protein
MVALLTGPPSTHNICNAPISLYPHIPIPILHACASRDQRCEAVVLEVGLGGALDATNVAQTALSVVCTSSGTCYVCRPSVRRGMS